MKDFLKIAAIGGGLYLLYRQFAQRGAAPPPPAGNGAPPPPAGNGATAPPPAPAVPPVSLPAPPAARTYTDAEKDALVRRAASGDLAAAAIVQQLGIRFNSDEWNHFRSQAGAGETTADLFPVGNRGYRMTIEEYLNARRSAGLAGLGQFVQALRQKRGVAYGWAGYR